MTTPKNGDDRTMQAVLDYIESVMPGVGAVVMIFDPDTQMMRPTTNLHPEYAIDFAQQCLEQMKATQPRVNPKSSIQ